MCQQNYFSNLRKILSHHRTPAFHLLLPFWWYRFQNSATVRDIGLKFGMVIVLGKLKDVMLHFPPGIVHSYRFLNKKSAFCPTVHYLSMFLHWEFQPIREIDTKIEFHNFDFTIWFSQSENSIFFLIGWNS